MVYNWKNESNVVLFQIFNIFLSISIVIEDDDDDGDGVLDKDEDQDGDSLTNAGT